MQQQNQKDEILEEKKVSTSQINEEEIPETNKYQQSKLINNNSIKISKGQKNAFIQNFQGIKSLELKQQIQARHNDDAFCLCILDHSYLAIGSTDATITIYNLKSNCKLFRKINYYYEPILVLEPLRLFHKTLLLSTGYDQIINVWDYLSGKKITDLEACGCEITKLCDNLDKNLIVGSTFDGRIILWSYTSKRIVNVLKLQSHLTKEKRQVFIDSLIEQEQSQQENQEEDFEDMALDSEMDLESHGSVYSMHQISSDHYLVLQRGCISEIKIIKQQVNLNQQTQRNNRNDSSDIQTEDFQQEIPLAGQMRNPPAENVFNYQIQVIRQFEANQDAIQFNVVPYESQKIITLGSKRGYVYLYDFDTGEIITSKKTHSGAVNEILTLQTINSSCDNPYIISTSHNDRYLKIESLKSGESFIFEDDRIFCYNECMNSKMQFFKNKSNQLFMAVICQEHQNPYFSIFQIHLDYEENSQSASSSSSQPENLNQQK